MAQDLSSASNDANKLEQPVNGFTGAVSYSIPLGSVSSGSLSFPISISYFSDGFKPNYPSGRVGLGWSENENYSISREVKGWLDENQLFCDYLIE